VFCDKCGAPLAQDAKFCANCGKNAVKQTGNMQRSFATAARLNKAGLILTCVYAGLVMLLYLIVFTSADLSVARMTVFVLTAMLCTVMGICMFFAGRKVCMGGKLKSAKAYRAVAITLFITACAAGILLVFMTFGIALIFVAAMYVYQNAARRMYAAVK